VSEDIDVLLSATWLGDWVVVENKFGGMSECVGVWMSHG